jgi:hypothetical protein
VVLLTLAASAADRARDDALRPVRVLADRGHVLHGGQPDPVKAARDTVYLLGGPGRTDGTFETGWNGFTSVDFTRPAVPEGGYWRVSDFNAGNLGGHGAGNLAMWCGTDFDGDPGYGNGWRAALEWVGEPVVAGEDPTIRVTAWLNHDTEIGYDYLYLQILRDNAWSTVASWNGLGENVEVDVSTVLEVDAASAPLRLRWFFVSDSWASDEDGGWPSDGACQIDDLSVYRDGEEVSFEDFESGAPVAWSEVEPLGVGDFAARYQSLQDIDACRSNLTTQVAFVDDGEVVPGTGGTTCITWCYGPGGYIVNNTGGLLGPEHHLRNGIVTPPIALPQDLDGLEVAFDVYDILPDFSPQSSDAGIYHNWMVRSTADADPAALEDATWRDRGLFYQGRSIYERGGGFVSDMMVDDARWMQLCLEVGEWGYLFGIDGSDGHPAPYFDNVAVKAYAYGGPFVSTRTIELAQDTFPELGDLDYQDLGQNSCRFDMAMNISPIDHLRNDPGDSLVLRVQPRDGGELVGEPRMIVAMKPNPLFDAVRVLPPGFSVTFDQKIKGSVTGLLVDEPDGVYAFDLPDNGFFFPGDEIHYFFEAADQVDGDQGLTRLPVDTTGFERFTGNQAVHTVFPPEFIVRGLPSLFSANPGDQPAVLVWDDGGDREEYLRWRWSLADVGYNEGVHYDLYQTLSPASGVGNGLGGRATSAQLQGYQVLLYTCDELSLYTLSNGDTDGDPSLDLVVLSNWLEQGDKRALFTGDNLVSSLIDAGATGTSFVNNYLGADLTAASLRVLIHDQTAPWVFTIEDNGVVVSVDRWIAYGGCPRLASFDALGPLPGAQRVAEYSDPNQITGVYPYAALLYHENEAIMSRVAVLPQSFAALRNAPDWQPPPGRPARARSLVLGDLFAVFGQVTRQPIATPDAGAALAVSVHPNPFNPRCTIALSLPRASDATVKVYDLRGALVRTLHEGALAAGRHELTWAGEDDGGRAQASGVYFYEVKAGPERRLGKLTLVK